jgi:replicative DNA helicase
MADGVLMADALPICNPEFEEMLLGALLTAPVQLNDVAFLQADDFFVVRSRWIWEAIHDARSKGVDPFSVANELEKKHRLAEVGGLPYVLGLLSKPHLSMSAEGYAREIENLATRRRIVLAAQQGAKAAHQADLPLEVVIAEAESAMRKVGDRHVKTVDTSKAVKDIASAVLAKAREYRDKPAEVRGMLCGIPSLDKTIGGFVEGRLYYLAARPAMGKSSLLAQVATGLAKAGHGVLFFSLEMTEEDLVWRMACQMARMDSKALELGRVGGADFKRFEDWIEDKGGRNLSTMRSIAQRYVYDHDIKLVVVDTLNRVGDVAAASNQYQGITNASHAIADAAHESNCAWAAAVQLSRKNTMREVKRPELSDLRDSGALEEDGDYIGGLHREYYYKPDDKTLEHQAAFYTLKHRHGAADGACELYYDARWPGFAQLEKRTIELNPPASTTKKTDTLEAARLKLIKREPPPEQDDLPLLDIGRTA